MNDRRYLLFEPTEFAYSEQKVAYRGQHYQRTVADLTLQTRGWPVTDRPYGLWLGVSPPLQSEERYVEVELDGASGRVRLDPQVRPGTRVDAGGNGLLASELPADARLHRRKRHCGVLAA